jgi:hypothetical protein
MVLAIALSVPLTLAEPGLPALVFYVAPNGNDAWSGTQPAANAAGTDGPFRSVGRARDVLRERRRAGEPPAPTTVYVRGGVYELEEALRLGAEDSGTPQAPVVYAAYLAEKPILSGGTRLRGWSREGVPRPEVWVTRVAADWEFSELFLDGKRLPRAASSNDERWETWPRAAAGSNRGAIQLPEKSALGGQADRGVEVNVVLSPGSHFLNVLLPVDRVDVENRLISFPAPAPYAIEEGDHFRLENSPLWIDRPGEWSSSADGRIFLWPPSGRDPNETETIAPRLKAAIELVGDADAGSPARFVTLRGLTFMYFDRGRFGEPGLPGGRSALDTNDSTIFVSGAEDCSIERCRIANVAGMGIRAFGPAKRLSISENEIADCGGTGVAVHGRDVGLHHENHGHRIERNHVHHCGAAWWHGVGIHAVMSADVRIAGNHVHDMPYAGIFVTGQRALNFRRAKAVAGRRVPGFRWDEIADDPLTVESVKRFVPGGVTIERNVVRDVMQRLDDGGAIYTWASHHNVIRDNLISDCARDFSFGIYLDAEELDTVISGNVVKRCPSAPSPKKGGALFLHQNGRVRVTNNVFAFSDRLFRFLGSYGGHEISRNLFLFGPAPIADETPDRKGENDFGKAVMDDNLFWSVSGREVLTEALNLRRRAGWDVRSTEQDPELEEAPDGTLRFRQSSPLLKRGFPSAMPPR